ncbi:vignain-like [Vigna unguiculata]|uniref:vignain-like n=1 Tax=Vigna unguiculata TaxID=3917 RepID=UPI001017106D|nr:vignain-like [Vigna unguiculata]
MAMKKLLWVILSLSLVLGVANNFDFHEKDLASEESLWDLYERWRSHHTVSRSLGEKHKWFNVFKANVMHFHNTNKMDKPYKLKLNKFADMTNHEFRSTYAGSKVNHHKMFQGTPHGNDTFMYENVRSVPTSVDWRKKGVVTNVKDQGKCAIVGYGITIDGTNYWIVRNSWGAEWGEHGYIKMQRNISKTKRLCGIAMMPSYLIKNSSDNPTGSFSSPKDEL